MCISVHVTITKLPIPTIPLLYFLVQHMIFVQWINAIGYFEH